MSDSIPPRTSSGCPARLRLRRSFLSSARSTRSSPCRPTRRTCARARSGMSSSIALSTARGRSTSVIATKEFVRKHPVATKRVLRAILKASDFGVSNPAAVARRLVDGGFTENYDYALQTLKEVWYNKWREYDAEDSVR